MPTETVPQTAEEAAAEAELRHAQDNMRFEMAQAAVDLAGIIDPTPISDGISASMSLYKGDLIGAGLSLVSMVPFVGDALAKSIKGPRTAARIAKLEAKILALTAKLNKAKEAAKAAAAETKLGKKAKQVVGASAKLGKATSKAVGQCPAAQRVRDKVDKALKAGRFKKYPILKLRPNWKNKLKAMPAAERKAALAKRAEAREYWIDKAARKKGGNLSKAEKKAIQDKIDSFDWSEYKKIDYQKKVNKGDEFNRVVDQGNTKAGSGFLTRTEGNPLPGTSTEAREVRALPDTSKAEELAHFRAEKDFEVMEGPLDGGSWAYHDDRGAVIAVGPQRTGGASQSVTMDGTDPNSLVTHTGSTPLQ